MSGSSHADSFRLGEVCEHCVCKVKVALVSTLSKQIRLLFCALRKIILSRSHFKLTKDSSTRNCNSSSQNDHSGGGGANGQAVGGDQQTAFHVYLPSTHWRIYTTKLTYKQMVAVREHSQTHKSLKCAEIPMLAKTNTSKTPSIQWLGPRASCHWTPAVGR